MSLGNGGTNEQNLILFALVSGLLACGGGKQDELTPYIQTLQGLERYSQQLMSYQVYLTTEGMTNQAHDVEQVMQTLARRVGEGRARRQAPPGLAQRHEAGLEGGDAQAG